MVARRALALLVTLAIIAWSRASAQSGSFSFTIEARSSYFEGEPIYLLFRVRNVASGPRTLLNRSALIRQQAETVTDSAGQDMRRLQVFVDVMGTPPLDTLGPAEEMTWVQPLHWFWGRYREASNDHDFYAFTPGRYRVDVSLPGVGSAQLLLNVRARTEAEGLARQELLAALVRVDAATRAGGIDSALAGIVAMLGDSSMAPYHVLIVNDVAYGLEGMASATHPSPYDRYRAYHAVTDSIRLERARVLTGAERMRLLEALHDENFERLRAGTPWLAAHPFTRQRLREKRRGW